MAIPEPDRVRYGHMPERLYWEMLEGEDPDDRAIREAHGIGYEEPYSEEVMCRNGCGLSYTEISSGKIRECEGGNGGWTAPPPECPVTGWPQIDRPDLDMCSCGHRHVKIEAWGAGRGGGGATAPSG